MTTTPEFSDVRSALALIPITKPLYAMYREMLAAEYPHLLARVRFC